MTGISRKTIKDVATLSGLSICTASRALRGLPNISATARERWRTPLGSSATGHHPRHPD